MGDMAKTIWRLFLTLSTNKEYGSFEGWCLAWSYSSFVISSKSSLLNKFGISPEFNRLFTSSIKDS